MANMSYCRFENTYSDLCDCFNAIKAGEKLSENEMYYAQKMRNLCESFIEEFDDYEECDDDE